MKLGLIVFALCFCFGFSSFALEEEVPTETKQGVGEKILKGAEKVSNQMIDVYRSTSERAEESRKNTSATILVDYSPLDVILPSKIGANIAWHASSSTLYELDYSFSSIKSSMIVIDLSSASETRVSLLKRNFSGGTFNWYWGLHYNSSQAELSPTLMSAVGASDMSDVMDVQTLGLSVGVGNRWVFGQNFSFGVDWFSWAQPLVTLKREAPFVSASASQEDKDDIDTALKLMAYFPRWTAFKFYLGYSF